MLGVLRSEGEAVAMVMSGQPCSAAVVEVQGSSLSHLPCSVLSAAVRALPTMARFPVIALCGSGDRAMRFRALAGGADAFVDAEQGTDGLLKVLVAELRTLSAFRVLNPLLAIERNERRLEAACEALFFPDQAARSLALDLLSGIGDERSLRHLYAFAASGTEEDAVRALDIVGKIDVRGRSLEAATGFALHPKLSTEKFRHACSLLTMLLNRVSLDDSSGVEPRSGACDSAITIFRGAEFPSGVRAAAARFLVTIPTKKVFEEVIAGLLDSDEEVSWAAVDAVVSHSSDEFMTEFIPFMVDQYGFCSPFNEFTGNLKYRNEIVQFDEHMNNLLPGCRMAVVFSLLKIHGAKYYSLFLKVFEGGAPRLRALFIRILGRLRSREPIGWLVDLLAVETDNEVLSSILATLNVHGDCRITLPVLDFLNPQVAERASGLIIEGVNALRHGDERVIIPVLGLMKIGSAELIEAGLGTLRQIALRCNPAASLLSEFVADPLNFNTRIRKTPFNPEFSVGGDIAPEIVEAVAAFRHIDDPGLPELIETTLRTGNNVQRKALASNIRSMGRARNAAREVIPLAEIIEGDDSVKHELLIVEAARRQGENRVVLLIRQKVMLLLAELSKKEVYNDALGLIASGEANPDDLPELVRVVGKFGDEGALNTLLGLFGSGGDTLRAAIVEAMEGTGSLRGLLAVSSQFASLGPLTRQSFIAAVHRRKEPAFAQVIHGILACQCTVDETAQVLVILGEMGYPAAEPQARVLLASGPPAIRRAAAEYLAAIANAGLSSVFWDCLYDPDPWVRSAAISGTGKLGLKVHGLIRHLAEHPASAHRHAAIKAAVAVKTPENLDMIMSIAETLTRADLDLVFNSFSAYTSREYEWYFMSRSEKIRGWLKVPFALILSRFTSDRAILRAAEIIEALPWEEAVRVCREIPNMDVNELFKNLIAGQGQVGKDGKRLDRMRSFISLLETMGREAYLPYLLAFLKRGSPEVFADVFRAIGRISTPKSTNALISALSGVDKHLYSVVSDGLINIGDDNSVVPLLHKTKAMDPDLRYTIIRVLRSFGSVNLRTRVAEEARTAKDNIIRELGEKAIKEMQILTVFDCRASL